MTARHSCHALRFRHGSRRRGSDSIKWHRYGPMCCRCGWRIWISLLPSRFIRALRERAAHGVFGYGVLLPPLTALLCARLLHATGGRSSRSKWCFCRVWWAVSMPSAGRRRNRATVCWCTRRSIRRSVRARGPAAALANRRTGGRPAGEWLYYEPDYDALVAADHARTRLFILCHPHNPVGRVYTAAELERLAEFCAPA